jgi:hypothetical protein
MKSIVVTDEAASPEVRGCGRVAGLVADRKERV